MILWGSVAHRRLDVLYAAGRQEAVDRIIERRGGLAKRPEVPQPEIRQTNRHFYRCSDHAYFKSFLSLQDHIHWRHFGVHLHECWPRRKVKQCEHWRYRETLFQETMTIDVYEPGDIKV